MKPAALAFFLTLVVAGSARAEAAGLSAEVTEHVREIHGRNPDLRDDAFSKMGGSSVASRAFLHCFATPYVELGEHGDLAETVEYFAAGRRNSFNRESDAAGVSWNLRYVLGDRKRNIFFMTIEQGREEHSNRTTALLWIDGQRVVVEIDLAKGSSSNINDVPFRRVWELVGVHPQQGFRETHERIIELLKEALTIYGFFGVHKQVPNTIVEFNF